MEINYTISVTGLLAVLIHYILNWIVFML